jgi:hypothetical protein
VDEDLNYYKYRNSSDPSSDFLIKYSNQCPLSVISVGSVVENSSDVVS